ncbi:hypothetical protein D9Q98_003984 [Chlorella vulgaris]|uniref:Uncharacterized protein n=1 Tax=Chlorella vulgaris TaxID=3077 RepID=A0A9D4YY45_CHLVU|nr:hypothetical protein D9Q98_003984 [Chlorella vulgaris]
MGNWLIKPLPHRPEFVAEFLRVQAAVAAQEALQELDGDLQSLLQLRLQFVDLKIVCAKYWRDKTRDMAGYHEKEMNGWMLIPAQTCTMKPYICEGGLLAHQRPAAWRRTQESFFCRLLALLEEERSALQEGRLVSASPLPALDEVPHTLPVDPSPAPCWMCSKYIAKVYKLEPRVQRSEHSPKRVTGFCWLPTPPYDIEYGPPGPVTPSGGAAPAGQSGESSGVAASGAQGMDTAPTGHHQIEPQQSGQDLVAASPEACTDAQPSGWAGHHAGADGIRGHTTGADSELMAASHETGGDSHKWDGVAAPAVPEWESCLEQEKQKEQEEKEEEIIEPRGKVISHQRRRLDRGQPVTRWTRTAFCG